MLFRSSFVDFQITVCRGSRAIKSSPEPKTVCYSARKRPEMTKFTSFVDFQITVCRGSRAIKSSPEPKTVCYSARKRPEMTKFTSFVDFQITVYRGAGAAAVPSHAGGSRSLAPSPLRAHRRRSRRRSCTVSLAGSLWPCGRDRKSTRLNSSHRSLSRMPSSA